jgi:hypothetical protein
MRDEPSALAAAESKLAELFGPGVSCPEFRRDYLSMAAWVFALLFGPVIVALTALVISGVM